MRGKPKAEGGRRGNVLAGSWFLLHPSSFILLPFSFAARSLLQPHARPRARRACQRRAATRRAAAGAEQLREPRLPGRGWTRGRRWWPSSTARRAGATRRSWRSTPSPGSSRSARSRWSRRSPSTGARCTRSKASASPSFRGAAAARPSWRTRRRSNGSGASSAASTPWARCSAFRERPALDVESHGVEPRDWLLASGLIPADCWRPGRARRRSRSTACAAASSARAT